MKPVHTMLEQMEQLEGLLGKKICFISMKTPDRSLWFRWLPSKILRQYVYQQIKHCEMAWEALKASNVDFFLIYEFIAPYVFPLLIALALQRKPVFFLMHGVQQLATQSRFHSLGLRLVRFFVQRCNGYAVHLELADDCLPLSLQMPRHKSLVIPLTHPLSCMPKTAKNSRVLLDSRIKIGVVGMLRRGKKTRELVEFLVQSSASFHCPVEVLFGTPFWQKEEWVDQLGIEVRDTSSEPEYNKILSDLDILIYDSEESEYYYRPSGVIGDALMNGCYVVCPDFPVFRAQIEKPVRVGRAFPSFEQLIETINLACKDIDSELPERFDEWRRNRTVKCIADIMECTPELELGSMRV